MHSVRTTAKREHCGEQETQVTLKPGKARTVSLLQKLASTISECDCPCAAAVQQKVRTCCREHDLTATSLAPDWNADLIGIGIFLASNEQHD